MKTVSVVIPNYNNAHYVQCAIQSVLSQTFTDYEIIVVDDGSTDHSREVVAAFGDKVRYIYQENKGLGGARNTGILVSNAEFIGLLDADDEWQPTFLEKMMTLAQQQSDAVVYYCAAQGMDSAGKELPQVFGRMISSGSLYQSLLRANFIIPSTVVFQRVAILEAGMFEEKNRALHGCEDWDLWLRLSPAHQFAGMAEVLVKYRLHTNTFSANPGHMQEAVKTVIEKNFGIDDGNYENWSPEKKRAFGGVYRYHLLSSVQKQERWDIATEFLRKGLEVDETLAVDLALFYELAFGSQPPGHRESTYCLQLEQNAQLIMRMLANAFDRTRYRLPNALQHRALATANYALGLVAYNTNRRDLSKRFLTRVLSLWPKLFWDQKVLLTVMKSYLPPSLINHIKRY